MSDNNLFPDLDSFNQSMPPFPYPNGSMHLIETNRILPGIISMTGFEQKLGPPPMKGSQEDSLGAGIEPPVKSIEMVQSGQKRKKEGCTCKKTNCLKMYCDCFSNGRACTPACHCCHCLNDQKHEVEAQEAREEIKSKGARGKAAGCNCKKTQCLKKYCECFSGGEKCGPHCKCTNCQNRGEE